MLKILTTWLQSWEQINLSLPCKLARGTQKGGPQKGGFDPRNEGLLGSFRSYIVRGATVGRIGSVDGTMAGVVTCVESC